MRGEAFKRNVYADLERTGTRTAEVAKAMGIHLNTFRKHLDDPDLMTRREMNVLVGYVNRSTMLLICPWWKEETPATAAGAARDASDPALAPAT